MTTQIPQATSTRNSNIELLRIICMLMVVILHFNNHGANNGIVNMPSALTSRLWGGFIVESFCIVAVNCFVLISGFFAIKLKFKSILKFYLQCFIIGLFSYLLYTCIHPEAWSIKLVFEHFLAFTHNGWWFVVSYLGLMLLSPLLNRAIEGLSKKHMITIIALFALIVIYLGWYQGQIDTQSGCSILNFIFLYLIGRFIGMHIPLITLQQHRWKWLFGYILACGMLCILVWIRYAFSLPVRYIFDYGHPIVIIEAILLFLFFASLSFHSKIVNWLASSVFAAYLIQESAYLGHQWIYPQMEAWFIQIPDGIRIITLLVISICFVILCIIIDKILSLLSSLIINTYEKWSNKSSIKL